MHLSGFCCEPHIDSNLNSPRICSSRRTSGVWLHQFFGESNARRTIHDLHKLAPCQPAKPTLTDARAERAPAVRVQDPQRYRSCAAASWPLRSQPANHRRHGMGPSLLQEAGYRVKMQSSPGSYDYLCAGPRKSPLPKASRRHSPSPHPERVSPVPPVEKFTSKRRQRAESLYHECDGKCTIITVDRGARPGPNLRTDIECDSSSPSKDLTPGGS